jgi:hypothetical protein
MEKIVLSGAAYAATGRTIFFAGIHPGVSGDFFRPEG